MTTRNAHARWEGSIKEGKGQVDFGSGAFKGAYSFASRFEDGKGTNPEELIAAAHAACFTMALSFALARAGHADGELETEAKVSLDKDGDGFKVSKSALSLKAKIAGIDEAEFGRIADDAKANCPISKLLNAEVTLEKTLG